MKKDKVKRSLIPDPIKGLLDIQVAGSTFDGGGTYEAAEEMHTLKIKEFYDPNLNPKQDTILSIYDGPRYGKKTLKELKKMCKDRGLPVTGTKKTLIDRLDEENKRIKKEKEIKAEVKRTKAIEKAKADKVIVNDTVSGKIHMMNIRLKKAQNERMRKLKILVTAQEEFDKIEKDVNEMKVTIKSLESLF